MHEINDRSRDIGPFVPGPDDDMIICRCEEVTKGEIRKAVHDGMFTLTEIRLRFKNLSMGLCQGQTCAKLVKGIVARELNVSPAELETKQHPGHRCVRSRCACLRQRQRRARKMKNNAEVVIIGGGIIGCATAYYLAKEGVSVIVLEKSDHIGNGGSSRNGGGVRQSGRDPRELPLAMYAVEHMWPTLSEELGVDVEYHKEGNLRLGKTAKHKEILQGLTDRAVALGLDVRMIDGKEVREINPYLSEEITVASWCPTDGHANPLVATLGFYKRARELGAEFITGEDVLEIQKIKGKARRVVTEKNVYEGETIVLASGYESRPIAASVGIDIPMRKELIEALVTEAEPKMFPQMLGTADADFYGHQTNHGSFVFGGASGFEAENRDNGHMITSSITAPCICRGIMKYIPKLADAKIVRTWAGYEDLCADGVPVLGPVKEVPGLLLACAFTGHGFGISPIVGKLLSELAMGKETTLDLHELRYDRFQAVI